MRGMTFKHARAVRVVLALVGALALFAWAQAAFADGGLHTSTTAPAAGTASVGTEQCITSTVQVERSATFTAQMAATATTEKMAMRIELQQRLHGESEFHTLAAPGFGVWRTSEPGVEIYKYVKQITNLDAPAAYRALVRFRWIDERGHLLKHDELHTSRCVEPALSGQVVQTPPATGA
jgi:hypothetical protein